MENEALQNVFDLHSTKVFNKTSDVPEEDVQTILEACVHAPNASNRQSYSIVDVDDREVILKVFGSMASRALLFCADVSRLEALATHVGAGFEARGMVDLNTAIIDATLAASAACVAANAIGVGYLPRHFFQTSGIDDIYERFGLPRHLCFPVLVLLLGYPRKEPEFHRGRLTGEGVVHRGTYRQLDDEALDRLVARYDDKEDHMALVPVDWERKGYDHYIGWYYTETRKPDRQEDSTRMLLRTYEKVGFLDRSLLD